MLDLVTGGNRDPATPPKATLDASRATYEQEARPTNRRLPDWDTISTNREMRRAAKELTRVRTTLGRN